MRRAVRHSIADGFEMMRLGAEAWAVIALRMTKLALGGAAAQRERQRMVSEKVAAAAEAQIAAGLALAANGRRRAAGKKALAVYRKRVRANRRRLSRTS